MKIERRKVPPLYFSEMRCNLDVCGVFPWDFFRASFLMYCVNILMYIRDVLREKNDAPNTVI